MSDDERFMQCVNALGAQIENGRAAIAASKAAFMASLSEESRKHLEDMGDAYAICNHANQKMRTFLNAIVGARQWKANGPTLMEELLRKYDDGSHPTISAPHKGKRLAPDEWELTDRARNSRSKEELDARVAFLRAYLVEQVDQDYADAAVRGLILDLERNTYYAAHLYVNPDNKKQGWW